MRMRISYTNYPQSKKLTNKSRRIATFTHPLYGIILGGILGMAAAFVFPNSVVVPMIALIGCPIAGVILLRMLRKKKFAQYDAEYAALLSGSKQ